jgi:nucleoside recognition membrane protein YjiH
MLVFIVGAFATVPLVNAAVEGVVAPIGDASIVLDVIALLTIGMLNPLSVILPFSSLFI